VNRSVIEKATELCVERLDRTLAIIWKKRQDNRHPPSGRAQAREYAMQDCAKKYQKLSKDI
jgi:hypothetical protein